VRAATPRQGKPGERRDGNKIGEKVRRFDKNFGKPRAAKGKKSSLTNIAKLVLMILVLAHGGATRRSGK
jgi:hypothetical protein